MVEQLNFAASRVAFVHTVAFLADEFKRSMKEQLPTLDTFHVLNESLLQDLLRGQDKATVYRRCVEQILLAADAGAQLIVVTCSSTSPAVDSARGLTASRILKIDDPMAAQAVSVGQRVGVLCTATSTVEPSAALLRAHAAQQQRSISIQTEVNAAAYAALMDGNRTLHDSLVMESARKLASQVDVLVLAQASLAHLRQGLASELACPVLASPPLLMQELQKLAAPR